MIHILWLKYFLVRGIRRIANVLCICCTNFVLNFWGETCLVQEISFSFRFHMVETTMTYYKCKLIYIVLKYLTDESNFKCIWYPKYNMYHNIHVRTTEKFSKYFPWIRNILLLNEAIYSQSFILKFSWHIDKGYIYISPSLTFNFKTKFYSIEIWHRWQTLSFVLIFDLS